MPKIDRLIRDLSSSVDLAIVQTLGKVQIFTERLAEIETLANETSVTESQLEAIEGIKSRVDALDPCNPEILITDICDG